MCIQELEVTLEDQMKKRKIVLKRNLLDLIKETPEERLERIHKSNLRTRVVKSKKIYDRSKFKKGDSNEEN